MALKSHAKFKEKLTFGLENDIVRKLENVKIGIFMGSFCPK